MGVKINLRIVTKNHAADPEKGFFTKSISKLLGRATAMPPAWELIIGSRNNEKLTTVEFQKLITSKAYIKRY